MDKKSLLLGAVAGTLATSLLAGGAVFAATGHAVTAQAETANYGGIKGSALVYGGTTYAELYAVQQALKNEGVVNQWNGQTFQIDTPSQSAKALATANAQLTGKMDNVTKVLDSLSKMPSSVQQQVANDLAKAINESSQTANVQLQDMAQGLENALQQTAGKPGEASTAIQNVLNHLPGNPFQSVTGQAQSSATASQSTSAQTQSGANKSISIDSSSVSSGSTTGGFGSMGAFTGKSTSSDTYGISQPTGSQFGF
ncbi:hypothetical protein [Sulfoacidibacillus thermotolerans]|uniref:DUF5667 domain-containing protein n=1 Tax=Sulfoacidibacillus thermotolerans TaxID=1765684 RepID=A0A2U3D5Q6_SULT2|nr:hypothetical protein [Sulfoacidibacillus thermotolerans]PWI56626.1 hypothetical protein BM613_12655 [Sulfoacidibacillus thermotolerans]